MVGLMQAPGGPIAGIHATFLARDGSGKADIAVAKKMLGTLQGSAVRLTPSAPHMLTGEGIETMLAVLLAMRRSAAASEPYGIWAALSLGNLAGGGDVNDLADPSRLPGIPGAPADPGCGTRAPEVALPSWSGVPGCTTSPRTSMIATSS